MNQTRPVRVLVVEDSPVVRELLVHLLSADPQLEVVGTAEDGEDAIQQTQRLRPDVITMDIHLPKLGGLEATRIIMETVPTPIVVVSGSSRRSEVADSFGILEAGALAMVDKPRGLAGEAARKLLETVKLMAEVKVVRRWRRAAKGAQPRPAVLPAVGRAAAGVRVVAIGASTGGPLALKTILSALPRDFPVPVAIAQHISPGFTEGFAQWLEMASGFPVGMAFHGESLAPGRAYVAPDGQHMTIEEESPNGCRVRLNADPPENGHRPAVSQLFRSLARSCGSRAVGVLLTGMGRDGAAELKLLRDTGAITVVQTPESSVVAGMPGEAILLGAACHVVAPESIPELLARLVAGASNGQGL